MIIPTINDYEDIAELHDTEEIENLFHEATKSLLHQEEEPNDPGN